MIELPNRFARRAGRAVGATTRAFAARRRARGGMLPFALIAGLPHSGTTLLARIVSEHSRVHVPNHETEAFTAGRRHAWVVVARLLADARAAGKTFVVEKTPDHVARLDLVRRMLPGSRFVLVARDGRDVTASIARRFGGDYDRGFDWWITAARSIVAEMDAPDVLLSRYEDLVLDPKSRLEAICAFLGLDFEPAMLDYHARQKPWGDAAQPRIATADPAHQAHAVRRQAQANAPIYDARGEGRRILPSQWVAAFSAEPARSLMLRLGYDPAG
ncbi:MAG: sulfotransferase [Bauldia sp.]|nr:sulfotransferase [Bauldia sp.]